MNYYMIKCIVDYVIDFYGDIDIESRFGRKKIESTGIGFGSSQIETIAALYDMSVDDVLNKIVETLEETPINGNGDCLSWQWVETTDDYMLYVKPDDDEYVLYAKLDDDEDDE